jgi:hypothetical protein
MSVRARSLVLLVSVVLLFLSATWLVAGARAQLAVGPSCASGGPYEIVAPCPEHSTSLVLVGMFLSVAVALVGTLAALSVGAPNLVVLHWTLLLGGLGGLFVLWSLTNDGGVSWSSLLVGLGGLAMALPGVYLMTPWQRLYRRQRVPEAPLSRVSWWLVYAALAAVGVVAGGWSADAWL